MNKQWMILAAAFLAAGLQAAETAPQGFVTTVTLGATVTDGNSDTRQANLGLLTELDKANIGNLRAGLEGRYGESEIDGEMDKTIENAKAFLEARKDLTSRMYGFLNTTFLYDDIADIDYRASVGVGPGWYLLKNASTAVSAEFGPSYVMERVGRDKRSYAALRVAERAEHKFNESAKVWQSVEYLPKITDFSLFTVNAELGAESAMTSRVNLRFVVQDTYNSEPAEDKEKNDVTFIAGLSLKL